MEERLFICFVERKRYLAANSSTQCINDQIEDCPVLVIETEIFGLSNFPFKAVQFVAE
jgi:hypothetical protein